MGPGALETGLMVCRGWGGQGQEHTAGQEGINLSRLCIVFAEWESSAQDGSFLYFPLCCAPGKFWNLLSSMLTWTNITVVKKATWGNNIDRHSEAQQYTCSFSFTASTQYLQYSQLISAFEVLANNLSLGHSLGSWCVIYRTQEHRFWNESCIFVVLLVFLIL